MSETVKPIELSEVHADFLPNILAAREVAADHAEEATSSAIEALNAVKQEISFRKFGCKPGVRVTSRGVTYEIEVVQIRSWWQSNQKPWLSVRRVLKSGAKGTRITTLYDDWELA